MNKDTTQMNINGKKYDIHETMNVMIQDRSQDVQTYGWTLEIRFKHKGEWTQWMTYWNNLIYQTNRSAMDAAIKIYSSSNKNIEFRILPLYKMSESQFREYKINQILQEDEENCKNGKERCIRAWKVIEDNDFLLMGNIIKTKKGTIFIKMENDRIIKAATTSEKTKYGDEYILNNHLLPNGLVEEIDIKNEKWIHPHLCKELKKIF